MDFARSGDLSIIALFLEDRRLQLDAAVYIEMRNVPFPQQLQIFAPAVDGTPSFYDAATDARGNGQMLAETAAQKYGPAYVHEVMISRTYMPPYRARYEDRTIRIPRHAGILDRGVPVISDGGQQRHGDSAVAGMLLEYAVRNDDNT